MKKNKKFHLIFLLLSIFLSLYFSFKNYMFNINLYDTYFFINYFYVTIFISIIAFIFYILFEIKYKKYKKN